MSCGCFFLGDKLLLKLNNGVKLLYNKVGVMDRSQLSGNSGWL